SPTLSMNPTALVGLAVSSYSFNSLSTATFSNVSVQSGTTSLVLAIDAGGAAIGSFVADTDFSRGNVNSVTNTIDTSAVSNPAPQQVYQSFRYEDSGVPGASFSYAVPNLTPGGSYTVRLDFAELVATGPGQRVFNVTINGTQVLTNFDIFAEAGGS